MSTLSQREVVQQLVYKYKLDTESAFNVATRLIEGAAEFKAALTPPEKDAFTLKDPELILVIHYPKEQDAPSTINMVLDIKRHQVFQQLKSMADNFDWSSMHRVITTAEKAGQLTRLEFTAILGPNVEVKS